MRREFQNFPVLDSDSTITPLNYTSPVGTVFSPLVQAVAVTVVDQVVFRGLSARHI